MRLLASALLLALPLAAYAADPCPVGITATRQAGLTVQPASGEHDPSAQGLHIWLRPPSAIASVEMVLYGLTPKERFVPVGDGTPDTISKTYEIHGGQTSFDLWMSKVATVKQVELRSVTYADGSTWHASAGESCRVEPSMMVLVANR